MRVAMLCAGQEEAEELHTPKGTPLEEATLEVQGAAQALGTVEDQHAELKVGVCHYVAPCPAQTHLECTVLACLGMIARV